jgi:FKBP-type peptidyl-prolyl cis-trans isomerase FkpA
MRILKSFVLLSVIILTLGLISCNPEKQFEEDEKQNIQDYLEKNSSLNFVLQPSGLYYLEVAHGTGLSAVEGDSAYVFYTGKFLDGQVFDSYTPSGEIYGFLVGENVPGFDEAITLMKAGGKCLILVPSKLGFGKYGSTYGTIPGYTPLLYDIELVKVVPFSSSW